MSLLFAQIASILARAIPETGADAAFTVPTWAPHAVALFAFASGVALWLAGRSYLRLTFCFAGAAMGALSGFEVFTLFAQTTNPFIGAGIGLVIGALLGLVAFRVVVAASLGVVGALAGALIALAALTFSNGAVERQIESMGGTDPISSSSEAPQDSDAVREGASDAWRSLAPLAFNSESPANDPFVGPVLADAAGELASDAAKQARAFFGSLAAQAAPMWNDMPSTRRMALSGAAVIGLLIGLLGGFLLPSRAAAVTTSFIGPAIWMPTGMYLLAALGVPVAGWAPSSPLVWIGLWLGAAALGLFVQWTRKKPHSDKA